MDIMVDSGDNFDPDSHFLFWKPDSTALMEAQAGDKSQARLDLQHALQLDPNNEAIRANLHKF